MIDYDPLEDKYKLKIITLTEDELDRLVAKKLDELMEKRKKNFSTTYTPRTHTTGFSMPYLSFDDTKRFDSTMMTDDVEFSSTECTMPEYTIIKKRSRFTGIEFYEL